MRRIVFAILALSALSRSAAVDELEKNCTTPPEATRARCYWYKMDGHITKEGITQDLEAMRRVAIGEGDIGIISGQSGLPAADGSKALTPQWWASEKGQTVDLNSSCAHAQSTGCPLFSITNTSGTSLFTDPVSNNVQRFYRVYPSVTAQAGRPLRKDLLPIPVIGFRQRRFWKRMKSASAVEQVDVRDDHGRSLRWALAMMLSASRSSANLFRLAGPISVRKPIGRALTTKRPRRPGTGFAPRPARNARLSVALKDCSDRCVAPRNICSTSFSNVTVVLMLAS